MNKEQAKERLCAIETEVEKLRRIIDEPEQRTPEAGDVWSHLNGDTYVITNTDMFVHLHPMHDSGHLCDNFSAADHCEDCAESMTYLGKFDEVYVKISDVREAVISYYHQGSTVMSTDALCKLNIITD